MLRHTTITALLALALSGASAFAAGNHGGGHAHDAGHAIGQPGLAAKATRTVRLDMHDNMRFTPADIRVRQGETVRFVVRNAGVLKHELVLGADQELKEHHELMKKHPGMEHDEPHMVTLAAGQSGDIVWQFTQAGQVDFACLQPGHYDAGMKGAVQVAKTGKR